MLLPPSLKLRRIGTQPVEAFGIDGLRTEKLCGPDAPTLASSWWSFSPMTVANGPLTGESAQACRPRPPFAHLASRRVRGRPDREAEPGCDQGVALQG
jgi:hypothetical protein